MDNDEIRKKWVVTSLSIQLQTKKIKEKKLTPKEAFSNIETHLIMEEWSELSGTERKTITDETIRKRGLFTKLNQSSQLGGSFRDSIAMYLYKLSKACIETYSDRDVALDLLNMALEIHVSEEVRRILLDERPVLLEDFDNSKIEQKHEIRTKESGNAFFYILRWILILPLGILGAILITFPLHWILYMTLSGGPNPLVSPYPALPEKLLQPFFSGFVFVFVSGLIAPKAQVNVAQISVFLWSLFAVIIAMLANTNTVIAGKNWHLEFFGIPVFLGIAGAVWGLVVFANQALVTDSRKRQIYCDSYKRLTEGMTAQQIESDPELVNLRKQAGLDNVNDGSNLILILTFGIVAMLFISIQDHIARYVTYSLVLVVASFFFFRYARGFARITSVKFNKVIFYSLIKFVTQGAMIVMLVWGMIDEKISGYSSGFAVLYIINYNLVPLIRYR